MSVAYYAALAIMYRSVAITVLQAVITAYAVLQGARAFTRFVKTV